MSLKLENEKNNFSNIIMEINMIQKRKHLLLLNRIMRTELKKDIIKTPSKITEDEVDKYFNRLFIKKDDYYVPIKSKIEIKIDEELFKNLIKKPKKKEVKEVEKPKGEEVKEVEKPKEEEVKEVEKTKEEQINEFYNVFNLYNYDYIYDNLSIIYKKKGIAFILNKLKKEMFYNVSIQKQILQTLLMKNKLLSFLNKMKDYKQKKDEPEKTKKFEEEQIKFKQLQQVNDKEEVKKSKDNDIAEFFKGKIKFNVIGK
jgi:hypothetical protein